MSSGLESLLKQQKQSMTTKFKLFFFYNFKKPKSLAVSGNKNKVELSWKIECDTRVPGMSLYPKNFKSGAKLSEKIAA